MKYRKSPSKPLLSLLILSLTACSSPKEEMVKILLEDGDYRAQTQSLTLPKGSDFTFFLTLDIEKIVVGASYSNCTISETIDEKYRHQDITFHNVQYSTIISLDIAEAIKITYRGVGVEVGEYAVKTHSRVNVSTDYSAFAKEGYAFVGWSNGEETISAGSRVEAKESTVLDAIYLEEGSPDSFEYELLDSTRASIKRYLGTKNDLVIPEKIEGRNVVAIENGAIDGLDLDKLVLPRTLGQIDKGAISGCDIKELVFFDNLVDVGDDSFLNSSIQKMRINAIRGPAYIRTYFGTYADKMDRLIELKDEEKIVLYSGSSTRFGFDSELIDRTFLGYDVVNLGVFAYTASYPQVDLLSRFLTQEDIVVVSPEFDAIEEQINLRPVLDWASFALCEANYDLLSLLRIDEYENVFSSYNEFQKRRSQLPRYSYTDTPYQYDEDGNYHRTPTYNAYGDYSLYRENNEARKSFGVKRAYYNKAHFPKEYLAGFNNAFELVSNKKARICYDFSPRMNISLSEDSTKESIEELGTYLKENIEMDFISDIDDSLMDPLYFYGTDNHLSSEGATMRTKRVIEALVNRVNS